jgi:hypothetical protein
MLMYNSTIICSVDCSRVIIRAPFVAGSRRVLFTALVRKPLCVSSSTSLCLCTIVPQSDSDSTITYQVQALDPRIPRPCCMLEHTHKLFGSSLCPQPNAVIILALTKHQTQFFPSLHSLGQSCRSRQAYRLPTGSLRHKNRAGTKAVPCHFYFSFP